MKNKKIEKAVDYIVKNVEHKDGFLMNKMFIFYVVTELKEEKDKNDFDNYKNKVIEKLRYYEYIEPKDHQEWRLTKKGIKARNVGGHYNYVKSKVKKMTKYELISLIISLLALLVTGVSLFNSNTNNDSLEKRIEVLEKKLSNTK